jgi:hypothetical protein
MSQAGITFHTLRDLLFPSDDQDTRITLSQVREGQSADILKTSSFSLKGSRWDPNSRPLHIYSRTYRPGCRNTWVFLSIALSRPVHEHRPCCLTTFMNLSGKSVTPDNTIQNIQNLCMSHILNLSYEHGASTITISFLTASNSSMEH